MQEREHEKRVIFIADDFGMNTEINRAILHTHVSGNLHGTALMMAQPGTSEAVAMARAHPSLQIGWHLHLNDSSPATMEKWPWDASPAKAGLSIAFSRSMRDAMRNEAARQWELFQNSGLPCQFVNCHHHLHAHPIVYQTLVDLLGPGFKGWIRLGRIRFFPPAPRFFDKAKLVNLFFNESESCQSGLHRIRYGDWIGFFP